MKYTTIIVIIIAYTGSMLEGCTITFEAPESNNLLITDEQGNAITIRNGHKGSLGTEGAQHSFLIYTETRQTKKGNDYKLTFLVTEKSCPEQKTKEDIQKNKKINTLTLAALEAQAKISVADQEQQRKRFIIEKTQNMPAKKKR